MINCIGIDDEPLALELIELYAGKTAELDYKRSFTNTREALKYLHKFPVDLLFLDIQMPEISGIEFYKSLPPGKMVIFTTAFSEYAVEGFDVNAVDYLLKPIHYNRFETAVQKACNLLRNNTGTGDQHNDYLYIRSNYSLVPLPYKDILYIEGLEDYVKIHLASGQIVLTRLNMKGILQKLPGHLFIRVHRSFIVSTMQIDSVRNRKIKIGETEIPIGGKYQKDIETHMLKP